MAIYSAGRRRTMIILLLSSILLITLDLRGNAVFDGARTGFGYAMRPFEIAGEVVTTPIERAWRGISDYDELRDENDALQQQLDAQRSDQIAAQNALAENRQMRALLGLESLAAYDRVSAEIIGSSPSNFDQRVEIDRGTLDGIRVGMPVVNDAGLVGKITNASPETSIVMLVTDPLYHVPVKVVAEVAQVPDTTTTTTTTTLPGGTTPAASDEATGDEATGDEATGDEASGDDVTDEGEAAPPGSTTTSTTVPATTTTTTTLPPIEVTRETGDLNGLGSDRLPRVRFIADSPLFGRVLVGDAVLTAGGSQSLSPPNIPVGDVINVIPRAGTAGLQLEVDLNADLDRLNFLTVILYQPPTELVTE